MKFQMDVMDIQCGARGNPEKCAVAFCVRRQLPQQYALCRVDVGHELIHVGPFGYPLPDEVKAFVRAFDAGESVEPISFELPIEGRKRAA